MNELQKDLIRKMMLHSPYSTSRYINGVLEPIYCAYCDAEPEQPRHADDCLTVRVDRTLDATPDGQKPDFSKLFDPPIRIIGV